MGFSSSKLLKQPSTMKVLFIAAALLAIAMADHAPHKPVHHQPAYYKPATYAPPTYHKPSYGKPSYHEPAYDAHAEYNYGYAVKDDYAGLHFGQDEARSGYATTGEYHVLLPDCRIQRVKYSTADGYSGNVVEVTYEGEPCEPKYAPHKPTYHEPKYAPHKPTYHQPAYKPVYHQPAYKPTPKYHA